MIKRLYQSPVARLIAGLLLIIAATAIVLAGSVYGFNCYDSPYMLFNVRCPDRGPVAMLTFKIAHGWCEQFGFSFESLGWLRSVGNLITFGLGAAWLAVTTRRYLFSSIVFFLTCLLGEICLAHYFNWDTAVFMWYVINAIAALEYIKRPSVSRVMLMGILSAVIFMARMPTILCGVIDFCLVIYVDSRMLRRNIKKTSLDLGVGVLAFIITVVGLMVVMCGSVSSYFDTLVPENFINGHFNIVNSFYRLRLFIPVIATWGGTLLLVAGAWWAATRETARWKKAVIVVCTYILCACIISVADTDGETPAYGLGQALFLITLYISYRQHRDSGYYKISLLVILLYAAVAVVGSDSMVWRLLALPMLPLALAMVDFTSRAVRATIKILMIELTVMSLYIAATPFYMMARGKYVKIDSLPSIGLQYATPDDMTWVGWAVDAKDYNDRLKSHGVNVGYMGGYAVIGEGLMSDTVPRWMNEFKVELRDKNQRRIFDDYFRSKDCIIYPSSRDPWAPGYVLIDDFVAGNDYEVIELSPNALLAAPREKARYIKEVLDL